VPSLRERKRERTRRALIDAAAQLFERKGYDETTVAQIAAAAEIGTRTFFGYFASKEESCSPTVTSGHEPRSRRSPTAIPPRGR
jgi:DNA-binding transcriptional regulator YbjK